MSTTDTDVTVTANAVARIKEITAQEVAGAAFRIAVNGGGCSGFQYDFSITTDREDDDLAIEAAGTTVLIDPVSLGFLKGSTVDFVDDLIGQSFKIKNPQAKSSCGCGVSFTI
jgi:iron-sulfur cluster assembly accessory protein